ncbi:MAG: mandelate racemase/muconate lactonizing enzyme family protein [Nitrospinota bacterium]
MKVEEVEVFPLRIPFPQPIASSLGTYTSVDLVGVEVRTASSLVGTGLTLTLGGDAGPAIARYIADELVPLVLGEEGDRVERLWEKLYAPNKSRIRKGLGTYALSALDIAFWDLLAQGAGKPLHRLLGGYRDHAPLYGSGGWHTLSEAELVAEAQAFAEQGIRAYKFKVGTPRDRERVAALRRELGDGFALMADANQKWNVREAIEASRMLADYGVAWLEEPVLADAPSDLAAVAAESAVPIAAGENAHTRFGFRDLVERRAAHILQPDACRVGGITEWAKVAHMASAWNLTLSSHLLYELHAPLVAAFSCAAHAEYMVWFPEDLFTRPFPVRDGRVEVSDEPGTGLRFRREAKRKYLRGEPP